MEGNEAFHYELLTPDVSVPKPLGKLQLSEPFEIAYRPSIVLLTDIFVANSENDANTGAPAAEELDDSDEAVDIESGDETEIADLVAEVAELGLDKLSSSRTRTPVKRYNPNQEILEALHKFKIQKMAELQKEIQLATGHEELTEDDNAAIQSQLDSALSVFLKQHDAVGDLEWFKQNLIQQNVKDELYSQVKDLLAFVESQDLHSDQQLLETMVVDAESLEFLAEYFEFRNSDPKSKKAIAEQQKAEQLLQHLKSLFTDYIFKEYQLKNLDRMASTAEGFLLPPSQLKELDDTVRSSKEQLLKILETGKHADHMDCIAYAAALEDATRLFVDALAQVSYARILAFWRERQSIAHFLNDMASKDGRKSVEYHLLFLALDTLQFFEELVRDFLDSVDTYAVDIFEEEDQGEEDEEMEDQDSFGPTFLPPFPGEEFEEMEEDEEDEEDEEADDDEDEDDEDDEDDESEPEGTESSLFEESRRSLGKKTPVKSLHKLEQTPDKNSLKPSSAKKVAAPLSPVRNETPSKREGLTAGSSIPSNVYEENGLRFSVMLNITDASSTTKFYSMHLVTAEDGKTNLIRRWGRGTKSEPPGAVFQTRPEAILVGEKGTTLKREYDHVADAKADFAKAFHEKTGNKWTPSILTDFKGKPDKYMLISEDAATFVSTPASSATNTPTRAATHSSNDRKNPMQHQIKQESHEPLPGTLQSWFRSSKVPETRSEFANIESIWSSPSQEKINTETESVSLSEPVQLSPARAPLFCTLETFLHMIQHSILPPKSHMFDAVLAGDVRMLFLRGYTNQEAAMTHLRAAGLTGLEVISPEGIHTLVVYQEPRIDATGAEDNARSTNYPSNAPSLHDVRRALDILHDLQARRRSHLEMLHLQIEFAKIVFGDIGRAFLNTFVEYFAQQEISDFRRDDLFTPSHILVSLQLPVASRSLLDVLVSFYCQIFNLDTKSVNSKTDPSSQQRLNVAEISKAEAKAKQYAGSKPLLQSFVQFAIYPPV